MTCTTPDCDRDAGERYLCPMCVSDLDQWLEKGRAIVPEMGVTIARLDNVRPTNNEGNNGTKSAGSAAPLNLTALQIQMDLEVDLRMTATEYAQDPWSASEVPRVIENIKAAERAVDNPPEARVITTCHCGGKVMTTTPKPEPTDDNPDPEDWGKCHTCGATMGRTKQGTLDRIQENVPTSLKTRDALKWIRGNSGVSIKSTDIRNWAREGKLIRTNPEAEKERPAYNVADILTIHYRHANSKKRADSF